MLMSLRLYRKINNHETENTEVLRNANCYIIIIIYETLYDAVRYRINTQK